MREISHDEDGTHESFRLLIINDYKNLVGIDLDTSNIKQKPAKFFYSFNNVSIGNYGGVEFAQVLNNFIGHSGNYNNPLVFNKNKYLNKAQFIFNSSQGLTIFSDHCFSYDLQYPYISSCVDMPFLFISFLINLGTILGAVNLLISKNDTIIKLIGVIIFPIVNIILYILYKICKYSFEYIYRIDCIYSKNFDRIFIGLVKYTKTKYINTFEYQINNISRFILERQGNSSQTNFNLKVVFKNNETQQIYTLKNKTQDKLEGFAYLLNERLNINSNNNIDSI